MKTTNLDSLIPEMQELAALLIKNGLRAFTTFYSHNKGAKNTYITFTDGQNIGYAQKDHFGGVTFSTVNKPCKECGTGFRVNEIGIYSPTLEDAQKAFDFVPDWAKYKYGPSVVKKYRDWDEYVSAPMNRIGEIVELIN